VIAIGVTVTGLPDIDPGFQVNAAPVTGLLALKEADVPIHTAVGEADGVTVGIGFTVIVPVAFTVPQPPVKGML